MPGRKTPTPDTTNYRQRTLDYLDAMVPFEIVAQHRLPPDQRAHQAQTAYLTVLDCGPTGHGKEQYSGFAALMYGGPTYEQERRVMLTALAAMAYQPGGITWMGRHWCTNHQQCIDADAQAAANRNAPNTPGGPAGKTGNAAALLGRPVVDIPLPAALF